MKSGHSVATIGDLLSTTIMVGGMFCLVVLDCNFMCQMLSLPAQPVLNQEAEEACLCYVAIDLLFGFRGR